MSKRKELMEKMNDDGFCANCETELEKNDKYCHICGTKRGASKFLPYENMAVKVYGPPVLSYFKCKKCNHKWTVKALLGRDESNYCPNCGSKHIENTDKVIGLSAIRKAIKNMKKNIIVISSSPRKNGNSETLAEEFIKGAKEKGHSIEMIKIRDLKMGFCKGCFACQKTGKCVIKDDITKDMLAKIRDCDIIVFVTPVYYYAVSGQLKTFIDRMNPIFNMKYKFKDIYIISTAAENETRTFKGVKEDIKGFVDCYEETRIKKTLFVGGVNDVGDIKKLKDKLKEAYEMGKGIK